MDESAAGGSPPSTSARAIIVMGVAGCGKTVVGSALARKLHAQFIEGDDLHPPENVARMASGLPLTDSHRMGWLDTIAAEMSEALQRGETVIASCSALKRDYRDRLRGAIGEILFVYLEIDAETARQRVGARKGHFMPATLVESQFAALEPPETDEFRLVLNGILPVGKTVANAAHNIRAMARRR